MTYEVPSMAKHMAVVKEENTLDSPLQVNHIFDDRWYPKIRPVSGRLPK